MSVSVVSFPSADIDGDSNNVSLYSAVHQPVVVQMQRKDFTAFGLIGSGDPTSFVRFSSGAATPTQLAEAVVGDYIYFQSGDGSISQAFQIVSIGGNFLEITYVYNGTIAGGFVNYTTARTNYYIETSVRLVNTSFASTEIGAIISYASPVGLSNVNVMEYLKSGVDYYESFNFGEKLYRDATLGGLWEIRVREGYNNTVTSYSTPTVIQLSSYVNSAKQLQQLYGYNMAQYVTSLLYEEALFMSDFVRPTLFSDYPFAMTFIISDHLYSTVDADVYVSALGKIETCRDVNGNAIASFDDGSIWQQDLVAGVYRILPYDSIPVNTKTIDFHIYVEVEQRVTEIKTIKYNNTCAYRNPVYLNWLGTNGGRNFWLFDTMQNDVLEVQDTGEFTPQVVDLATDIGNGEYLGKTAIPELICRAYLELEDIRGLKGLLMSPDVLMLTNNETWQTDNTTTSPVSHLPKWKRVKLLPQTFKVLNTNQTHAEIEVTLLLPTINIQTQ